MASPKQTIVLISGANSGIGLATATQLAKDHGYHVIIGSRKAAAGEAAAASLTAEGFSASSVQLDLDFDESIAAAVHHVEQEFGLIDVLINNAGVMLDHVPGLLEEYKHLSTRELFTQTMSSNVTGAACLTEACLPLLRKSDSPRLIFVSSIMGSIATSLDKTTAWYGMDSKAYDASKAALNVLAVNYVRILDGTGAMVNVACPGLVNTKLSGNNPYGSTPELGAQRIVELATAAKGGPSGTWTDRNGVVPW